MYTNPDVLIDLANDYRSDQVAAGARSRLLAARRHGGHRRTHRRGGRTHTDTVDTCVGGTVPAR